MAEASGASGARAIGILLIAFAIAFNIPYAWLAANFDYPAILRRPAGEILAAFLAGGAPLILAWAAFMACGLLLVPVALGLARVTARGGVSAQAVAAIGIAAGVTQAIGLSRWVFAVPRLAKAWADADGEPGLRLAIEMDFTALHQFAGVGIGEAIGQILTGFWMIGMALGQWRHPRFRRAVAALALLGGIVLLLAPVEGLATVIAFDAGPFGLAAPVGFLILTVWMIWTGVLCLLRPAAAGPGFP